MAIRRYLVVRTDDDSKQWIWSELQQGRLRQGWGIPDTQLVESGAVVPEATWKARYQASTQRFWNYLPDDSEAERRYRILLPLTPLSAGDVIVIPKMPAWGEFSIAVVSSGYSFDTAPAAQRDQQEDYRHTIGVDSTILSFAHTSSVEAQMIAARLRGYQAAVNTIVAKNTIDAIDELLGRPSNHSVLDPHQLFGQARDRVLLDVLHRLRPLSPMMLEDLVASAFEAAGYVILRRRHYDGDGGDADIVLTRSLPVLGDYADSDLKVFVQVKQKTGIDTDDIAGIRQLVQIASSEPDAKKVHVSTADEYTEGAKAMAREHGIVMISGKALADMILTLVGRGSTAAA